MADPIQPIPQEPDRILTSQVVRNRSEPRLLEWSMMDVTCNAQHGFSTVECNTLPGGAIVRTAHSRFRVAHGLSSEPQEVTVGRLNTEIGTESAEGATSNPIYGQQVIPDTATYSGFNSTRAYNSTAYSLICVNTTRANNSSGPADATYSYFTIGFPIGLWPIVLETGTNGACDYEVPEYCGYVRSAEVAGWWGGSIGNATDAGSIQIGNPSCGLVTGTNANAAPIEWGPPIDMNRVIRPLTSIQSKAVLLNAFLGIRDNMSVTVRIISRLWDAPTKRGIYTSPGPEAHPAP